MIIVDIILGISRFLVTSIIAIVFVLRHAFEYLGSYHHNFYPILASLILLYLFLKVIEKK